MLNFIKLAGWQLSGVVIFWIKIFPGGNFMGGNYPVAVVLRGKFPCGNFPRFLGGSCLGGNFPGGSYPEWEFSLVEVFQVGNVQWEWSGWQFSGWEFSCYREKKNIFKKCLTIIEEELLGVKVKEYPNFSISNTLSP